MPPASRLAKHLVAATVVAVISLSSPALTVAGSMSAERLARRVIAANCGAAIQAEGNSEIRLDGVVTGFDVCALRLRMRAGQTVVVTDRSARRLDLILFGQESFNAAAPFTARQSRVYEFRVLQMRSAARRMPARGAPVDVSFVVR